MSKELIYTAQVDRVLYPDGEDFQLNNRKISINIKGDRELAVEELIAFYYDTPYYKLTLYIKDLDANRSFIDFKENTDNILSAFSKWLNDIKGVKITNLFFDKGYINKDEVNSVGKKIVGSGYAKVYQFPIKRGVDTNEIEKVLKEIDDSNDKLDYLEGSEKYFEKRREILHSRDTVGGFISLYAFLQDIIGVSKQKDTDDYIRSLSIYDIKHDRKTSKPNQSHLETIFTWLRNQIGHLDLSTRDYNEITTEINSWYEVLYDITLIALQDR